LKENKSIRAYVSENHKGIKSIIQKCRDKETFFEKCKVIETSKVWEVGLDKIFLSFESKFVMKNEKQKDILTMQYPSGIHFQENQIIVTCGHFSYLVKELIGPILFPDNSLEYWHMTSTKYGMHHMGVKVDDSSDLFTSAIYGVPRFFQNAAFFDNNYLVEKINQEIFSCIDFGNAFPFYEVMDKDWIYLIYVDIALEKPDWLSLSEKDKAQFKSDFMVLSVSLFMNPLKKKKQMQRYMVAMLVPYRDFLEDYSDFQDEDEQQEEDHFRLFMEHFLFERTPPYQAVLNRYLSKNTLFGEISEEENVVTNVSPESFSKNMKDLIWETYKRILMRLSREDFIKILKERMKKPKKNVKRKK
jgi:hypothetical protein